MGHEGSGTIHAVGTSVTTLQPDDLVAIEPSLPCRVCSRCKSGMYHLCPDMKFGACPPDTHGLLTRFYKLPADFCYRLPEGVGLREGVLCEPLAVGVHAVRMVWVRKGMKVVVMGAGTVGLCAAVVARWCGAQLVVLVDVKEEKVRWGKEWAGESGKGEGRVEGIVVEKGMSAVDVAKEITNLAGLEEGADAVVEATGSEPCIQAAVEVLRKDGHFVQTGLGRNDVVFPALTFSEKELHYHGAFRYGPGDFDMATEVLASRRWKMEDLVSKVWDFEDTTQAWESTKKGEGIKNMIRVGGEISDIDTS